MTAALHLQAYFHRIRYAGETTPTLETLEQIHYHHPLHIPFENINPLLGRQVKLDLASIQQKLITDLRGGYCFEHNLLFGAVLRALGFSVKGLAARVLWNIPEGVTTARGHMLLLITLNSERYIADVGFGGLTLTAPLLLQQDVIQATPHESFRLLLQSDEYVLQGLIKEEWKPIYRFNLQEQLLPDYEVTNWYLSTHPQSRFVNGLIAARAAKEKRYTLQNNELAIHHLNGDTVKEMLPSAEEIYKTLADLFGLNLPPIIDLMPAFQKLMSRT